MSFCFAILRKNFTDARMRAKQTERDEIGAQ